MNWINQNATAIGAFKDVLLAAAAVVGIYIGVSGLRTWRRQLVGSERYHAARRLLRATYRYRDAIDDARLVLIQPSEVREASDAQEAQHLNTIYANRLRKVRKAGQELDVEMLEAEAGLRIERATLIRPLEALEGEMMRDFQCYMLRGRPGADEIDEEVIKTMSPNSRQVFPRTTGNITDPEHDPFTRDLRSAVSTIESSLKAHFKE